MKQTGAWKYNPDARCPHCGQNYTNPVRQPKPAFGDGDRYPVPPTRYDRDEMYNRDEKLLDVVRFIAWIIVTAIAGYVLLTRG